MSIPVVGVGARQQVVGRSSLNADIAAAGEAPSVISIVIPCKQVRTSSGVSKIKQRKATCCCISCFKLGALNSQDISFWFDLDVVFVSYKIDPPGHTLVQIWRLSSLNCCL